MEAQNHLTILITLVFLLLQLQVLLVFSDVVDVGSTLSTNGNQTSWLSPAGEFAFGFRQLNGTSTNTFSIAIWYNKIPDKTIVWHAITSNNDLVEAPPGSQVQLTPQGLTLTNPQGESIWTAQPTNNDVVSYGSMLDSGNFILLDGESNMLWESFQNPTDTLLPNQSLQLNATLTSRFTETNFTIGRFQLYFQDGNVFLSPLAWPSTKRYINYFKIDVSGSASRLVFDNTTGDIYAIATNGTEHQTPQDTTWKQTITFDSTLYYYRATLDYYGVFTQYSHPKDNNKGWTIVRYVPDNICTTIFNEVGSGTCGYNSYCSMENQRPTCTCPSGFSMVDQSNQFAGCQSNFTFVCGGDVGSQQELYQLPESAYINFPLGDYASLGPYSPQECQQSCLQDCMCGVAIYNGDGKTCWKKSLPLINGRKEDNNPLVLIFVKRTVNVSLTNYDHDDSSKAKTILLGSLIGSIFANAILLATLVLVICLRRKRLSSQAEVSLQSFTYDQLKDYTKNFSEEVGKGGFGIVYKGTLENVVAVKVLNGSGQEGEKDFKTELIAIAKTRRHNNLVRLIGFCDEGIHRMLVCEFMSRGTLANALFGQARPNWNRRVEFVLGVARGLVYLHEECDAPIIHCDINPQNILIDEHFIAKISDFGFAKLMLRDQSKVMTVRRGTPGYIAPEWDQDVPVVTAKVDVYSFGVMLLEIICCKRNVLTMDSNEKKDTILEARINQLMENDEEASADSGRLKKWVKIAILCIQENPKDRPTMRKVMQMLEGDQLQKISH